MLEFQHPSESPSFYDGATGRGNRPSRPEGSDMYAVIKTGGKQYRVSKDDVVTIERVAGDAGATVQFDQVLMVGSGADVKIGAPMVSGAIVTAELVEQSRGPKLIAFKKRRRKNSRRKKGHRQDLSIVRITDITGA
jgi:large subunit ribosomal protein L21